VIEKHYAVMTDEDFFRNPACSVPAAIAIRPENNLGIRNERYNE
jgi:hypothetical protein